MNKPERTCIMLRPARTDLESEPGASHRGFKSLRYRRWTKGPARRAGPFVHPRSRFPSRPADRALHHHGSPVLPARPTQTFFAASPQGRPPCRARLPAPSTWARRRPHS